MPLKKVKGIYRGKVRIGVTPDGKPIDKYVSGKTIKELEIAKEAARDHFIYGRVIPKDMQFFEYAQQWYTLKKEPFISNASRAAYKSCFLKYLLPEFGLQHLRAINAAQIQKFVNEFAGMSKSQITLVIGTLKSIFSSALAEGIIDRDPTGALVRPRASKKDDRRPLTQQETECVLKVMKSNPDGLMLAVLYYLGVRRGEALGLQWGDFYFDRNHSPSAAFRCDRRSKAGDQFRGHRRSAERGRRQSLDTECRDRHRTYPGGCHHNGEDQ